MSTLRRSSASRRAVAAAAIGAIALGSVVGLATVANAAPDSVMIVDPTLNASVSNTVEVFFTVAPAGAAASTAGVELLDSPGGSCEDPDFGLGDTSGSCVVTLPLDTFGLYLVEAWSEDGTDVTGSTDRTTSPVRGIVYGSDASPTIGDIGTGIVGSSFPFFGTGPALGTFSLFATPADGSGTETQVCGGPGAIVSDAGTWSCLPNFGELRGWNVYVRTISIVGIPNNSGTVTIETRPDYPSLGYVSTNFGGAVSIELTGEVGSTVSVDLYEDFGGATVFVPGCPANPAQTFIPPATPNSITCFFSGLPVGIHLLSSAAFINDVQSSDRGDLLFVPGAPTVTAVTVQADGSTLIEGTRPPAVVGPLSGGQPMTLNDGTVIQAVDAGSANLCLDDIDTAGTTWSCVAETTVVGAVRAYATGFEFRDNPDVAGTMTGGYFVGQSAFSGAVDVADYLYVSSPADEGLTSDSTPTVRGTGTPASTVRIFDPAESTICGPVAVSAGGAWECTLSDAQALDAGVRSIDVALQNGANTPLNTGVMFVVEAEPATPTITAPAPGYTSFDQLVVYEGSIAASTRTRQVTVTTVPEESPTAETCVATVPAGATSWSCSEVLPIGSSTATAVARFTDYASFYEGISWGASLSNPSQASAQLEITIEALDAPTTAYSLSPGGFTVTVTGEPGVTIETELYLVEEIEGEPYQYGEPVAFCPGGAPGWGPGPVQTCTFSNREPGIWNIYTAQFATITEGPEYSPRQDDYILIPEPPTLDGVVTNANSTVTFSGSGISGNLAIVRTVAGATVCQATVSGSNAWTCTAGAPGLTTSYRALQQSQGFAANPPGEDEPFGSFDGFSSYTGSVTVTVAAAPIAPPGPTPASPSPTPTPTLPAWTLDSLLGLDDTTLELGRNLTLGGTGVPPLSTIVAEIRSTPRILGTTVADLAGTFSLPVVIPADMDPGKHTIVLIITPPGGTAAVFSEPVTIVAAASLFSNAEADAAAGLPGTGIAGSSDRSGSSASDSAEPRSDPAAPSAMTDSIPTYRDILLNPLVVGSAGGLALAVLLLVAFPSELLNSTLSSNSRRFGRWFEAVERVSNNATATFVRVTRTPAAAAAVLVLVTSILFGFVDPNFGFDPTSVRLVLALAIALFVITYVSSWISGSIIKRAWGVQSTIELQPSALLFALIGVVIARLLEFSPGFLIGLVIGLEVATNTAVHHRIKSIMVKLGVLVGLSIVAWIAYSMLVLNQSNEPTFFSQLLIDSLASVTAEGLTAAFVSLLPLGFLEGRELFQRSKKLWVGTFLAVGTVFSLIVLPTAAGDSEVRDVLTWTLVLVAFAVVTLGIWAWMHFTSTRASDEDDESAALDRVDA